MFSPTRTALCVAICATLGLATNEASAGCKLIAGQKVCATWITGSEICQVTADSTQFSGAILQTATCIVRGHDSGDGGEGGPITCNDDNLTGVQTCGPAPASPPAPASTNSNAGGNGNGWAGSNPARQGPKCDSKNANKNPACVQGTPDLGNDILTSPTVPLNCKGNGLCTATAEVDVPDDATCSNGGALLDFTADSFVGVIVIQTDDGPEGFAQLCTRNSDGHTYTCTDPTENFDQFDCENPPD